MKRNMVKTSAIIAATIYRAPNTGANAASEANAPAADATPPVNQIPEGEKGKVGAANPVAVAFAKERDTFISELKEHKEKFVAPAADSEAFKTLMHEQSVLFKEVGDNAKAANKASAEVWPIWDSILTMEFDTKNGRLNVGKFCKEIWNLLDPEVKLENPLKPGKFYAWNEARKYGNSAAMTIENVRNYIRNNGEMLYPQFFVKPEGSEGAAGEVADLKPWKNADRAVKQVLALSYLPTDQYVALDANGQPKAGAKPVTLAEMLKSLKDEIESHIPQAATKQEKADVNYEKELEAERAEVEKLRAEVEALKASKEGKSKK